MKSHQLNQIDISNFIFYTIYIVLISLVAYSDQYLINSNLLQNLLRLSIIFFSCVTPFFYRFILKINFKKTIFIPFLIFALILDISFSIFFDYREHQVFRLIVFLCTFPFTYLIFISNLEYKNNFSSTITKIQIKLTLLIASIISIFTPTFDVTEKLPFVRSFMDTVVSNQYNSSSIELYYITILIIYASFLRMKIFINKDYLSRFDNITNLILLIPTIRLITITYASITALVLSATSLFAFYCFSFFKTSTKKLLRIILSLIPLIFITFKEQIFTTINIILEINNAQFRSAFLVRLKMLSKVISTINPFFGEGSCSITFGCNHAHNVFTDLSITLGMIGFIAAILYLYILFRSLLMIFKFNSIFGRFQINAENFVFLKRSNFQLYLLSLYFFIFILSFSSEIPFYWATFSFLPFICNERFFEHIFQIYEGSKNRKLD